MINVTRTIYNIDTVQAAGDIPAKFLGFCLSTMETRYKMSEKLSILAECKIWFRNGFFRCIV